MWHRYRFVTKWHPTLRLNNFATRSTTIAPVGDVHESEYREQAYTNLEKCCIFPPRYIAASLLTLDALWHHAPVYIRVLRVGMHRDIRR